MAHKKYGRLSTLRLTRLPAGMHADGGGLYAQVKGDAVLGELAGRSWIFRYTPPGASKSKSRYMGLGALATVSLAEARVKALEHRKQLLAGKDPLDTKASTRSTPRTFDAVMDRVIVAHAPSWGSNYARQWRVQSQKYISPIIGKMPVSEIDTGDVMSVLEPIWPSKVWTASLQRQRIEVVLDYATTMKWRSGANPARWKGHLVNLLPSPARVKPVVPRRALPWEDIPKFLADLQAHGGVGKEALIFCILTASRVSMVRHARVAEFDLDKRVWEVPREHMKMGIELRVPLAPQVVELVRNNIRPGFDVLFPGRWDSTRKQDESWRPVSATSLTQCMRDTLDPADTVLKVRYQTQAGYSKKGHRLEIRPGANPPTIHGFRAAFRTWAGETTSFPREVVEMALAHKLGDATERAYARGDLFTRRRELMNAWAEFCLPSEVALAPAA